MQMKIRKSFILLFSAVIAVLLFGCAFMFTSKTTAHADTEETHDHSTMTDLSTSGELTTGEYYLTDNIDGNISVTGEVTLCLNGHTITGSGGTVIIVTRNATFTLCDCVGTGCITGGTEVGVGIGGGVRIEKDGSFVMSGGMISNNTASFGGGVNVGGTFTMTGGTISNNTATTSAGGVYITADGTFKMTGGTISNNTGNFAFGGVLVDSYATFELSGTPKIIGNKTNYDNTNNVCFDNPNDKITVAGELTEGAQIGVNKEGTVATGYKQDDDPSNYFIPDDTDNNCIYVSDKASGTVVITEHFTVGNGTVDKEPTCTEPGSESQHCTNCDKKLNPHEIPARGHTLTHHEAVAATEENEGNKEYWSCDKCGNYFSDEAGENEIADKTSVTLPKLTPATPTPTPEKPSAPAEENKSYWWLFLLLIPIAIAVGGVMLGLWVRKDYKDNYDN